MYDYLPAETAHVRERLLREAKREAWKNIAAIVKQQITVRMKPITWNIMVGSHHPAINKIE